MTDTACDEQILFEMLLTFTRFVRSINSKCAITMLQLLHRQHVHKKQMCDMRRSQSGICCTQREIDGYNKKVDIVNGLLKVRLPATCQARYWCHRSLWSHKKFETVYDNDGVHLSSAGMLKYARSIRGAMLQAIKSGV